MFMKKSFLSIIYNHIIVISYRVESFHQGRKILFLCNSLRLFYCYIGKELIIKYNMKFVVIRKRTICFSVLICLLICSIIAPLFSSQRASSPKFTRTIVIDAGHGGVDGGCVGKRYGAVESELNLLYAEELEQLCWEAGFKVVMTRSTAEGLYSPLATNKKKSEMQRREKIIKESDADVVVSIHMNSITIPSVRGAQVFFKKGNEEGKILAEDITTCIVQDFSKVRSGACVGDYYVLNCNEKAAVLIECGYLSNAEEEYNLMQEKYRKKFCKSILKGIINFLKI